MPTRSLPPRIAVATVLALGATTLTTTPAVAAPVFGTTNLTTGGSWHDDDGCTSGPGSVTPLSDVPVVENGPSATASSTSSGSVTDGGTDTQNGTADISGTGKITSSGADPKAVSLTATATAEVNNTVADSTCYIHVYANVQLNFEFTLTRPTLFTMTNKSRGKVLYTELNFYLDDANPYVDDENESFDVDTTKTVVLEPGHYGGYWYAEAEANSDKAFSGTAKATMLGEFTPVGSQTAPAAGKGKKYVTLPPTARSCTTDAITTSVTGKSKRAKTITKVDLFVNGKKVKTIKKPAAGAAVTVPVAHGTAAAVKAVATLTKRANGKPRKPAEVTATYAACGLAP